MAAGRSRRRKAGPAAIAKQVLAIAKDKRITLVAAESCTAGLLGQLLSDAPGAATQFHGGFVTYTKAQKTAALGVRPRLLREKTAVCREVARAMAQGAVHRSPADLGVAITGVAGPKPDEDGNPVGFVCIAVSRRGGPTHDFERRYRETGRRAIRRRAVIDALAALAAAVRQA